LIQNKLEDFPIELTFITSLVSLSVSLTIHRDSLSCFPQLQDNQIARVPHEINQLSLLQSLILSNNPLTWLPIEIGDLLESCEVNVHGCPLAYLAHLHHTVRFSIANFDSVFGEMTQLEAIRRRATTICFALAPRQLPALIVLEIIDAALPNNVRMKAKWDLIVAVKNRSMTTTSS
jgi:Leucine-rich repeat (LRR) protein